MGLTKKLLKFSDRISEMKGVGYIYGKQRICQYKEEIKKPQKELALLLGTSLKTVRSYEQGWRNASTHAERQLYLLISRKNSKDDDQKPCWVVKKCPSECKEHCPAWEFQAGKLYWFVSGTICEGNIQKDWNEKMEICRSCEICKSMITSHNN